MSRVNDIIKILTIHNEHFDIIGSYSDQKLKFFGDVDLQNHILHLTTKGFVKNLKRIVREINITPNVYFIDFKMGTFRDKAIHLSENDVMKGSTEISLKKERISMEELLLTKSIIKLDVSAWISKEKRFVEISINYYFRNEGIDTSPNFDEELSVIFKDEYFKKLGDGDYMKAVKRLYRLVRVQKHDDHKILHQLERFLNSGSGKLGNLKDIIETLIKTIDEPDFDSWEEYLIEMNMLEDTFNSNRAKDAGQRINSVKKSKNKKVIIPALQIILDQMETMANERANNFIKNMRGLGDFLETV